MRRLPFFWFDVFLIVATIIFGVVLARLLVGYHSFIIPFGLLVALIVSFFTLIKPENALYFIIVSMVLSPEINLGRVPGRAIVVRAEDIVIIMVFFSWLVWQITHGQFKKTIISALDLPLLLMVIVWFVSTSGGVISGRLNPVKAMFYVLKYVEYYILYFLVVNTAEVTENHLKKYLLVGLICCLIVAGYAYLLMPKYERVFMPFDTEAGIPGGESGTLGGYLLFMISLLFGFFVTIRKPRRWIYLLFIVFLVPPFIRSLSRASFYAIVPALVFLFILAPPEEKIKLVLVLSAGFFLLSIFAPGLRQSVLRRLRETFTGKEYVQVGPVSLPLEMSAAARVDTWRKALTQWVVEHPLFGYGVTGVGLSDAQYPLIIGETGLIGFFSFLFLIYNIFHIAFYVFRKATQEYWRALALGLIVGLVGFLFQSIAVNTFIIIRIMEPFWFVVGLIARKYVAT